MLSRICIDELLSHCHIGCLDTERTTQQDVRVDLWVELDTSVPARADALDRTWNYAGIAREVDFILRSGRFWLLESASMVLLRWLLAPPAPGEDRPPAIRAGLSITKFGVLPQGARPRLQVEGSAAEQAYTRETNQWGTVDVIAETDRLGLYRLHIDPSRAIPNHVHHRMQEYEMVLTTGVVGWHDAEDPRPWAAGDEHAWRRDQPHGYHNPLSRPAAILCLDRPRFDPSDEVVVPGGLAVPPFAIPRGPAR